MFSHTVVLRDSAVVVEALNIATVSRSLLGKRMGQLNRFTSNMVSFVHYDTTERKRVRDRMTDFLELSEGVDTTSVQVVLTGMGGTGKSHNLAYWVSLQRKEGHMVVYVHDMQNWLNGGDRYIFEEIGFAIRKWEHWGVSNAGGEMVLEDVAKLSKARPWASVRNPENTNLSLHETLEACVKAVKNSGMKKFTSDPEQALANLRVLVDAISRANNAKHKLIFVVDQDNKLNSKFTDGKPSLSHQPNEYHIDSVISANRAHLTVASASANNEGWERRDWPKDNLIVQRAHGLGVAEANHMMMKLLPTVAHSHDKVPQRITEETVQKEVLTRIREETECNPLDMKIICRLLSRIAGGVNLEHVEKAINLWKAHVDGGTRCTLHICSTTCSCDF
jgi:hypothetical protein